MAIKRRTTTHLQTFDRKGAEAVKYDLSKPDSVTITVPAGSKWTSEAHWHETHTEYLQILRGRAFVRLGNHTAREFGPGDGVIEVPKFTVHEWHRIKDNDEDLIVREWTVPQDGQKEVFFRMLNSFLTEERPTALYTTPWMAPQFVRGWIERWVVAMQLFVIFRSCDNWPVFVGGSTGSGWLVTHLILSVCSWVGYVFGLRGWYREYVTEELLDRGKQVRKSEGKKGE